MIGFKLDPTTNDITSVGGKIALLSTVQEAVRQRLNTKLNTFAGEWFLDTTYGIPYRQQIMGKGLSVTERDAIYIAAINEDPDVQRIAYFNSQYDSDSRQYSVQFEVVVADQLLRVQEVGQLASEEIDYGDGINQALLPSCNNIYINYSLALHPILHEDLPLGGSSSWIYGHYVEDGYVDAGYFIQ